MGIKEGALALADELEAFEDGDCEECIAYGQPECKGHLSCAEIIARYSARKVREAVERDAEDVTTVSAYDLLSDDDSEALAWVREHGGLEAVEKRLMPEGMEWPRFEDDAPVKFGDMALIDGDADMVEAVQIWIHGKPVIYGDNGSQQLEKGERVKRPAVLAADGEPLEVGQTVWHVGNGVEFTVIGLPNPGEYQAVKLRLDDGAFTGLDPNLLTHQRPVLDADGVPIHEGDTVWNAITSAGPLTVGEIERSDDPDEPEDLVWCGEHAANGFKAWRIADQFTHTKPEPPDSRQAIVNEIGDEMAARIDLLVSSGRWSDAD